MVLNVIFWVVFAAIGIVLVYNTVKFLIKYFKTASPDDKKSFYKWLASVGVLIVVFLGITYMCSPRYIDWKQTYDNIHKNDPASFSDSSKVIKSRSDSLLLHADSVWKVVQSKDTLK